MGEKKWRRIGLAGVIVCWGLGFVFCIIAAASIDLHTIVVAGGIGVVLLVAGLPFMHLWADP